MRFSLVFAALLCFTTWMSTARATHGSVSSCCLRWSDTIHKVPLEQIVDYKNQSVGVCQITAVVFETRRGRRICSDPNSARTKKVILKLDKEKEKKELQEKPQTEEGSASTITPAMSTSTIIPAVSTSTIIPAVSTSTIIPAMSTSTIIPAVSTSTIIPAMSTSTIIPAVSSASKNAPQNTRRHGRRRQRKRSRKMRNWQRRRV